MISELLKTRTGIIIVSIIWGLGLSTLFRKACEGYNCRVIEYVSPNVKEVEQRIYNYGTDSCYQYYPQVVSCETTT